MIDVTEDIHSLTAFKRNSSGLMKHMKKKTDRPLVLTVNGKAEAVLLPRHTMNSRTTWIRSRVYAEALGRPEKVKGDWRTTFWANSSGKTEDYGWPTGLSLTPQAAADLRSAYRYIRRHAPGAAREWIRRARRSVKTLSNQPPTLPTGPREQFLMTNPSANCYSAQATREHTGFSSRRATDPFPSCTSDTGSMLSLEPQRIRMKRIDPLVDLARPGGPGSAFAR